MGSHRSTSYSSRRLGRQQRVLQVLLQERGRPLAVDAVAQKVGVSERTVERDLEAMRAARIPLRGRGGFGGGVWLDVTRASTPLQLSDDQVMALLLVLEDLGTQLPDGLNDTREQLRQHLEDPRLF